MRIKVYNDGKEVFCGDSDIFLADNDGDEEVQDMLHEAKREGKATRHFYHSGEWKIVKEAPLAYVDAFAKVFEGSELWKEVNQKAKNLYEAHNRIPSEEEYQALRNVLICKVVLEDKEVFNKVAELTYNELRRA